MNYEAQLIQECLDTFKHRDDLTIEDIKVVIYLQNRLIDLLKMSAVLHNNTIVLENNTKKAA